MDPTRADLWEDGPDAIALREAAQRRDAETRRAALAAREAENDPNFVPSNRYAKREEPAPAPEKPWWKVWGGKRRTKRSRRKRTRRTRKY